LINTEAHLLSDGTISFETTPNLYLRRLDGKKEGEGKILRMYPLAPN